MTTALPGELPDPRQSLDQHLRLGMMVVGALLLCLLAAATLVTITGAVAGAGQVAVASKVKSVAHPTGGVIAAILVQDGDRVKADAPLIRFDTRVAGVSASMSAMNLDQLLAQQARLQAERDGLSLIHFPAGLTLHADPSARQAMAGEQRLFQLRRAALSGQQAQLAERVRQLQQQIASYQAQIAANQKQSALIEPERKGVRNLWERKLVTINRLNELERTAVSLEGNVAALQADIAQTRARIAEIRQQSIQIVQDSRSQAATQLAEVEQRLADQQVRTASAGDTFDRSVVRAPADGIVDALAYTTIGGVVPPAQTILRIVPDTGPMTVEAKISPADIDQIHTGQPARIAFAAFNRQTTPQLQGVVSLISAERFDDPRTGQGYYAVRIDVPETELQRLGGLQLVPGMPAEVYIQTGGRSLLSYLTKPLQDQFARAFREN
ncbi:HlyD family type I secretion periplasmic adaptor subunit [Rhizorhapis sp. SPR117]|uniref:HlyD family type I secretion periplasmic adaptor subunit n=1 Tax=Rhizorhapis sp. SPR117 TaxID=2912611 RepID=UPI001F0050B4|nr:HlyD family type I secretion periplasmic adaptor subunit [Rhizorhapis sp. SPR117]